MRAWAREGRAVLHVHVALEYRRRRRPVHAHVPGAPAVIMVDRCMNMDTHTGGFLQYMRHWREMHGYWGPGICRDVLIYQVGRPGARRH